MNEAGSEAGRGSGSKKRRKIHLEKTQVSLMSKRCYAEDNTYCRNFVGQKKEKCSVCLTVLTTFLLNARMQSILGKRKLQESSGKIPSLSFQ